MPSVSVDLDAYELAEALDDCSNRELERVFENLRDETSDRFRAQFAGHPLIDPKDVWLDIEAALNARDFDALASILWPEVKARWPKPKLHPTHPSLAKATP